MTHNCSVRVTSELEYIDSALNYAVVEGAHHTKPIYQVKDFGFYWIKNIKVFQMQFKFSYLNIVNLLACKIPKDNRTQIQMQ